MVKGLTPPSRRRDEYNLADEIEELRDIVRFTPATTNTSDVSGFGGGPANPQAPAVISSWIINPSECIESVIITYTESTSNTDSLQLGDEITVSGSTWKGRLVAVMNEAEKVGTGSSAYGDERKKRVMLEPSNPEQLSFPNTSSQTFACSARLGWAATYVNNSNGQNVLALKSSTSVISRIDNSSATIKTISGGTANGQIITLKPRESTTLTLETGGNIDLSSSVSVSDTEFVMLQFFDDDSTTINFSGGGGAGAQAKPKVQDETISNIFVTQGGAGYSSAPTVSVAGGSGSSATATSTVSGGKVTAVSVTAVG